MSVINQATRLSAVSRPVWGDATGVGSWIESACEAGDWSTSTADLYAAYCADRAGLQVPSLSGFTRELRRLGLRYYRTSNSRRIANLRPKQVI